MQAIRSGLAWLRGTEESCSEITPDIPDTSEKFDSHQNVQVDPSTPERTRPTSLPQSPFEETHCEEKMSNFYIYGLMWSCLLAQVWLHLWLFNLLLIPCMYMGLKHAALKFGFFGFIREKSMDLLESGHRIFEQRKDALIPAPLRGLWRLLILGDQKVRRIIDDKNDERAAALEKQILEIFDRVYELWHSRNSNSSSPDLQHVASFDSLVDGLKTLNMDLIVNFVKENIGTLLSVLESVWTILKGNISLAFSAFTAIISLLFGGGTAVLNFVLNFIVFSTSLFYLLCASGDQYKPVEVCSGLLPSTGSGTQFGRAVEEAINGVFAASFKMAAFYGLYTWLIHTLFAVKIIYIPSVLAAIFGAVPFLGAYWACLPAVLELWLVNGQIGKAGIMLLAQLIPTSFVDSAIYSEIKGGGHPYLTGLAIAGGIFCLGFEGALFGPMLLCVLFVAMHMYRAVIHPSYMDGRKQSRAFSLKRMFTIE
ncbi:transmembrane protein 245-like isoform X3 [Stegodyphus dumicola]|uniref:transmembrane protein 245-like isoform X3 n=1 Tax=Stegodyphus dumicola TaxID=202533 RepID=UPI0015AD7DC3|nr:transmembrane protein 245-like isoform X3 [Stegodyphus dumicola]